MLPERGIQKALCPFKKIRCKEHQSNKIKPFGWNIKYLL
jgi:hypothetical protein